MAPTAETAGLSESTGWGQETSGKPGQHLHFTVTRFAALSRCTERETILRWWDGLQFEEELPAYYQRESLVKEYYVLRNIVLEGTFADSLGVM